MTVGAAQFNQVVIDKSSSWFQKITALDRPLDEICSAVGAQSGGFAVLATPTMGAFVANPTPTLPVIVANPTATLPVIAANPTATPEPGVAAVSTNTPTPELPEQAAPPAQGGNGQAPGVAVAGCFGCLPDELIFPSGRIRAAIVATDASGIPGIYALDAAAPRSAGNGQFVFRQIPLNGLPAPLADYYGAGGASRGSLLLTEAELGYFVRGSDVAGFMDGAQIIDVIGPGGSLPGLNAQDEVYLFVIHPADITISGYQSSGSRSRVIRFPTTLTPAPYAPVWSADGSMLFMSLTDAQDMTAIYALLIEGAGPSLIPLLIVQNAFAPAVAPNGRYIAFERNDPTGRNIYALALNGLRENPITQQQPGAECHGAQFGASSLKIFFTCRAGAEQQMYVYGLGGVSTIETGIANAQNPMPAETDGFIYFDDGSALYVSAEDGSGTAPVAASTHGQWIEISSVQFGGIHKPGGGSG